LIRSRRGIRVSQALADEALDTLQAPLDGDVVAAWIAGFLAQASGSRAVVRRCDA
jgi:hypothetical protein